MNKSVLCLMWLWVGPIAAQEAPNCNDPTTQMEMNACAWRNYKAADEDLNADYKRAMDYMKQADADYLPEGDVPGAVMFRDAQRAWIVFRNKNCDVETVAFRGGSIVPLIRATCLEEMTRRRSEQLHTIWEEN